MLRTWAGIVDVCPDASPIVGPTPVDGLYVNCGWGTGGFKATPGSGWAFAWTIAHGEPHELNAPFSLERFTTGALIDEHGAAGGRALMLLIRCPWCGERDETEFSYGGQAGVAYPADPAALSDEEWARVPLLPRQPARARSRERWVHTHGCRRWFDARRATRRRQ